MGSKDETGGTLERHGSGVIDLGAASRVRPGVDGRADGASYPFAVEQQTTARSGRPSRTDLALAGGFAAVSLLQVLIVPIASRPAGVVVALGSTLPLAWRRSRPVAAALTGTVVWLVPTPFGFLLLGYVIAALLYFSVGNEVRDPRVIVAAVGLGAAISVVATLRSFQPPPAAIGSALAVVAPAMAGWLVSHQRAQTARLQHLTDRLVLERDTAERAAAAEERTRIARELHDVIGHDVTVIAVQAEAAAAALRKAPDRAVAPVLAIRESAADALAEMRRVLGMMREGGTDDPLSPQPGLSDLERLVARSCSAGAEVELTLRFPSRPAPASVELAAYRLVQEALTNARTHAPGAPVRVEVDGDEHALSVRVLDTGGPAVSSGGTGFGLVGMRERVRVLGGDFDAGPLPGGGFAVTARLPLDVPAGS